MKNFIIFLIIIIFSNQVLANEYVIPKNGKIVFNIERKDKVIGKHTFLFDKKNGIVTVNIDVNIQVKLGFLTIYKYIHKNEETWKESELYNISTKSTTNSRKKYFALKGFHFLFIWGGPTFFPKYVVLKF